MDRLEKEFSRTDSDKISSFGESFPWYVNSDGVTLDFKKELTLEEGITVLASYIKTRYNKDGITEQNPTLSNLLGQFYQNDKFAESKPTFPQLIDHINKVFKQEGLDILKKDSNLTNVDSVEVTDVVQNIPKDISKNLGKFGDKTINEVMLDINNLNLHIPKFDLDVTINPLSIIGIGMTYKILINNFNKYYVHA